MSLIAAKVFVLMFLPIAKFISGLALYSISKRLKVGGKRKELLLTLIYGLLSFGAGVLLAIVFLDILQVIQDSLNTAREHPKEVIGIRYVLPWQYFGSMLIFGIQLLEIDKFQCFPFFRIVVMQRI